MRILVTGGAGFIGSHLVEALVRRGHAVRVLDSLDAQVHGAQRLRPAYLNPAAELVLGVVSDFSLVERAMDGMVAVFHFAAAVGVGQSMYEVRRYVEANTLGGANVLEVLTRGRHQVRKVVVASSMSVYGEGAYRCPNCGEVYPTLRSKEQLRQRWWDPQCPKCQSVLTPVPTREDKSLCPTSIYAITKRDHEEMFLCVGRAYGIPTTALRYFNVYGPRQALSNPYTGAAAIFCARFLSGHAPLIFEDGLQTRDFVHVQDIIQANLLALDRPEADFEVFNVGTGRQTSVLDLAKVIGKALGSPKEPQISGRFREGDIRHCFADVSKIRQTLGYKASVSLEEGLGNLVPQISEQLIQDQVDQATAELARKRLVW